MEHPVVRSEFEARLRRVSRLSGVTTMPRFADTLAVRLRRIRVECYGREGVEALSDEMGIHARTWENFEAGFTIPGVVLLRFIDLTGCDPRWLLTGTGSHYLGRARALEPSDAPRMRALGEDSS